MNYDSVTRAQKNAKTKQRSLYSESNAAVEITHSEICSFKESMNHQSEGGGGGDDALLREAHR